MLCGIALHSWEHLVNMRNQIMGLWLLFDDFNEILLPSEVLRGSFKYSCACQLVARYDECMWGYGYGCSWRVIYSEEEYAGRWSY